MLFVENPEEYRRLLPGYVPKSLVPCPLSAEAEFPPFPSRVLAEFGLSGSNSLHMSAAAPGVDGSQGFWTDWFLAGEAEGSQYDGLRQVMATAPENTGGLVCLALSGRRFHGQRDRKWWVARGNLHLSLGISCDLDAAECGLVLPMLPAVAVVEAMAEMTADREPLTGLGIKWVNDILLADRKIAGVLTSARSQDGRIKSVVLGIGLNVNESPAAPPTPFTPGTTSLGEHIPLYENILRDSLEAILQAVAARFQELADRGPAPLLAAYRAHSLVLGQEVEIHPEEGDSSPIRRGRVLAIGPDLSLTLSDSAAPATRGRLVRTLPDD